MKEEEKKNENLQCFNSLGAYVWGVVGSGTNFKPFYAWYTFKGNMVWSICNCINEK